MLAAQVTALSGLLASAPTAPAPTPAVMHRAFMPGPERTRYVVRYGLFGDIGDVAVQLTPAPAHPAGAPVGALHARGSGQGAVLGIASFAKLVDAEVDPVTGLPRRWTNERRQGDRTVQDTSEQTAPGSVSVVRRRSDRPTDQAAMNAGTPVYDPLSFLVALRAAPPATATAFRVLDGRGLWIVTVSPGARETVKVAGHTAPALQLSCDALPIDWAGGPDGKRDRQPFRLWLADDAYRTPLVVTAPMGLADVRIEATGVDRPPTPAEITMRYLAHRGVRPPGGLPPAPLDRPRLD